MIYDVGDKVILSTVVRDDTGTPVNTATLVVAVTKPDGTLLTPAPNVTNTGAGGVYTAQVTVDAVGLWRYAWTASGTVVAVDPDGQFTAAAARVLVASLEEFKAQLNRSDVTDDAELRTYLHAATDWVEETIGGPLAITTITEQAFARGPRLWPRRRPLVSVTSVTPEGGAALDTAGFTVDTDRGTIRLTFGGAGWYTLVYRAGLGVIPERVKLAGLMVATHLWTVQNGGGGLPFPGDQGAPVAVPGLGFAVPNRARELLAGYGRPMVA